MKNILELLQTTAAALPDKQAVTAPDGACTWRELWQDTERAGTALTAWAAPRTPVPVLMDARQLAPFYYKLMGRSDQG